MVKKYACCLRGPYQPAGECDEETHAECRLMLQRNAALATMLRACKDQITAHHATHVWEVAKHITNTYELVAGASMSSERPGVVMYNPISRSFFKLWELLHDYWTRSMCTPEVAAGKPVTAAFLAEGPGGFMEAFARYRALRAPQGAGGDRLHGMTLLSRHRAVPNWKLLQIQGALAPGATLRLHVGADGTGDVCQPGNVDHLVDSIGEGQCELVTADGGFDFSADFARQEELSMGLVAAEVYAALRLQAPGGALVLKVYDLHTTTSLRLMYMLRGCYVGMRVVKPLTSRSANSEKYVLCTGFTGVSDGMLRALRAACAAVAGVTMTMTQAGGHHHPKVSSSTQLSSPQQALLTSHLRATVRISPTFVIDMVRCNTVHAARQVRTIAETLLHIRNAASVSRCTREQLVRALRWCHRYGLRAAPAAVHYFASLPLSLVAPPRPPEDEDGAGTGPAALEAASSAGTT